MVEAELEAYVPLPDPPPRPRVELPVEQLRPHDALPRCADRKEDLAALQVDADLDVFADQDRLAVSAPETEPPRALPEGSAVMVGVAVKR